MDLLGVLGGCGDKHCGVFVCLRILSLIYHSEKTLNPLKSVSGFPLYLSKFQLLDRQNRSFMSAFSGFYS